MKKIKILIEKGEDHYGAYADNVAGIYGAGDTIAEVKQSVLDAIGLLKKYNTKENIPAVLEGAYELVWQIEKKSV